MHFNYLPMQARGPKPKGRYDPTAIEFLFSELKREGSNFSGFGK